ncbi:MAG: hypothetical protein R3236_10820, partial [Phycisphaeraceae bacterium]|nr:hypothetical protein [Phycisphaeraceae bacterium]
MPLLRVAIFCLPVLIISFQASAAEPPALNDLQFVEELERRDLGQVLEHFVGGRESADPMTRLQLEIARHRSIASRPLRAANRQVLHRRKHAAYQVIRLYEKLFETAPADHWQQPIWKTDCCDWILGTVLPAYHGRADLFVQYGLPTDRPIRELDVASDQRGAYRKLVHLAFVLMRQAEREKDRLVSVLPRRKEFERNFLWNGRWSRLKHDYGQILLPLQRARAIQHARYLQKPEGNLRHAQVLLKTVSEHPSLQEARRPAARSLRMKVASWHGRLGVLQNDHAAALKQLNRVIESDFARRAEPTLVFESQLARGHLLA